MGLVTDLLVAQGKGKDALWEMNKAAEIIVKYYCKKYKIDSDQFVLNEKWIGHIDLYKSGVRLDDAWTLVNNITIPEWAFDEPDKYIKDVI